MRRFVAPELCEVGAASGIHVFDVFGLRLGIGLGKFRTFKNVFKNEFMVFFSTSSFIDSYRFK